jgi:hypothetical protein
MLQSLPNFDYISDAGAADKPEECSPTASFVNYRKPITHS